METTYLSTVTMPYRTGAPEDVAVTTLHWRGTSAVQTVALDAAAISTAITAFWLGVGTNRPISSHLSRCIDGGNARTRVYRLSDARPRVPVLDSPLAITPPGAGVGLPQECATVLSMRAVPASGQAAARLRGRMYVGPVNNDAVTVAEDANEVVIVAQAWRDALIAAIDDAATQAAASNVRLAVFSPTTAGVLGPAPGPGWTEAALAAATTLVTQARVDAQWDTQRRRGGVTPPGPWIAI